MVQSHAGTPPPQLCSTLTDRAITEVLEPWATMAFDDTKAQKIIHLDQLCKELECSTAAEITKAKEAAHLHAIAEVNASFKLQLDICTKQSIADIKAHEAEL